MAGSSYQTKNQFVEEAIRAAISSGELRPGMWVRPEEWTVRLDISLTPFREALRSLEGEGLVKIHTHRGARVARIQRAEFEEVYQLRSALEGLAAYRAVVGSDEAQLAILLKRLEDLQAEMEEARQNNELARLRRANRDFHFSLYERAASPRLLRLIDNLWLTYPWGSMLLIPDRPRTSIDEHRQIIEAVRSRNADAARKAVAEHVDLSGKALIAAEAQLGLDLFDSER